MRLGLCALLVLGACQSKKPATQEPGVFEDRVVLGTYGPLSGPAAAWGVYLRSWEAYFAFINAQGGIAGRRLELRVQDDQYRPARTESAVRRLVDQDHVFAIVGGIGSATTQAVAPFLEKRGVPLYTPASGEPSFSEPPRPVLFTAYPRYDEEGGFIARYAASRGWRRLAVMQQDDGFGDRGAEGVLAGIERAGGSLVARARCLPGDTTVGGQVRRLISQKPDAVVLYTAPSQAVLTVRALRKERPDLPIITSFVLADPIMFKLSGSDWNGVISSTPFVLHDADTPAAKMYRDSLESFDSKLAQGSFTLSAMAYAMPLTEALKRAGRDLTRKRLLKELEGLVDYRGAGPFVEGPGLMPLVRFGPNRHNGAEQMRFIEAKDGRYTALTDFVSLTSTTQSYSK